MSRGRVGDLAPAFAKRDQAGRDVSLDDLVKRGPVVLYFYPRDFSPICTAQVCGFRDAMAELDGVHHASVVGVSKDDDESHRQFAARHHVTFHLLADTDQAIAEAYGVSYLFGLRVQRVTFVIGRDKRIVGVFRHELSAKAHLDDVKACLKAISAAPVTASP